MANVGFKLGLQSVIDQILSNAAGAPALVEGCFYLTSDTNRLYIANKATADAAVTLKPVNEGVITVANVAALNNLTVKVPGSFYYATAENVLCVYNGQRWVQINAVVTNKTFNTTVGAVASNSVTVTQGVTDSENQTKSNTFKITGADGVTLESDPTNKNITVKGDPISVAATVSGKAATVAITSEGGINESFGITAGTNMSASATGNVITLSAVDTKLSTVAVANHETSGFNVTVTDTADTSKVAQLDPAVKVGEGATAKTIKFVDGTATLPVHTKDEITGLLNGLRNEYEADLQAFNAMEYMGTVGTQNPSTGEATLAGLHDGTLKSGATFLVSGSLVHNGTTYPSGTLVVAKGEETNGAIPEGNAVEWHFITGSTQDTTYHGEATSDGFVIKDSANSPVGTYNMAAGTDINVTMANTSGNTQTATVAHKAYSAITPGSEADAVMAGGSAEFAIPVITGITTSNGHLTGYKVKNYKVKDTNLTLNSLANAVAASTTNGVQKGVITQTLNATDGTGTAKSVSGNFSIESTSLAIAKTANTGMSINMVWGTF